jgi:hypothetical protein
MVLESEEAQETNKRATQILEISNLKGGFLNLKKKI